jgi:hypothetical protein
MSGARAALEAILRAELAGPVLPGAQRLAAEIRAQHGDAVVALLFYGSCLRRGVTEGVLDFYAIVDGYRAAYRSPLPALLGAALPPNVHYLELPAENLRTKYALISLTDFARRATPASLDCRIWSRFCQPARIAWARDDATREALVRSAAEAALTLASRVLAWTPGDAGGRALDSREAWARAFHETYRAELRSEQPASIDAIAAADPARYATVLRAALVALAERGECELLSATERELRVAQDPAALSRARRAWRLRRPLAKTLAIAGLLKTAFTFQGWLPYVVWKLERHSGKKIELSDRQRRRPLVYAWPVIFRLLRDGVLR